MPPKYDLPKKLIKGSVKALGVSTQESVFDNFHLTSQDLACRIVSFDGSTLLTVESLIDKLVEELARIALGLWPNWFEEKPFQNKPNRKGIDSLLEMESIFNQYTITQNEISKTWLKAAINTCQNESLPLFDDYPKPVQVSFLSKVIHPTHLVILLKHSNPNPVEGHLFSIVRVSEWFAFNSNASIGILVPVELLDHEELSSVYSEKLETESPKADYSPTSEENKSIVWPIVGQPHPFSPGEQLLAKRLSQDAELGALFHFNQRVETIRKNTFLVDLLWETGHFIIEVDGYRHHSERKAFTNDRQRDYELLISGYRVLRLDHEEIVNDVDLSIEKIRDVVNYINKRNT